MTIWSVSTLLFAVYLLSAPPLRAQDVRSTQYIEKLIKDEQSENPTRFGDALNKLDVQAVREALKAGADPNERYSGKGLSAVHRTVMSLTFDRETILSQLEDKIIAVLDVLFNAGARIRPHDRDILHIPAMKGASHVTRYLLDRGADPNGASFFHDGYTPVIVATEYEHRNIVSLLVSYGAKPLDPATEAQVLFIKAVKDGDLSGMRDQLAKGARVNGSDPTGRTALVTAIAGGEFRLALQTVRELLRLGASPNLTGQGTFGDTSPLHAVVDTHERVFEAGNGALIIEVLLKAGAHVSSTSDWRRRTPLHIAANFHNTKAVEILLKAGAKVMARDSTGKTPLDYAQSGSVIKLLKSYGAKESP